MKKYNNITSNIIAALLVVALSWEIFHIRAQYFELLESSVTQELAAQKEQKTIYLKGFVDAINATSLPLKAYLELALTNANARIWENHPQDKNDLGSFERE